jgi:5-formyltetrahydrofolate cyclo-ligase
VVSADDELARQKQAIREAMWARLVQAGVVGPDVSGYIPDFVGTEQAAERLAALPVWRSVRTVFVGPDRAQLPVRVRALEARKLLYMAAPKLAGERPFYVLDPEELTVSPREAGSHQQATKVGRQVGIDGLGPVDLFVCGSVVVNTAGVRLGKGGGYTDRELALFTEAGLVTEKTVIATTVHELQVVEEELPHREHDFRVDMVATTTQSYEC